MKTEGTVPSPRTAPALYDSAVLPVREIQEDFGEPPPFPSPCAPAPNGGWAGARRGNYIS
jgi:hypothetical protein